MGLVFAYGNNYPECKNAHLQLVCFTLPTAMKWQLVTPWNLYWRETRLPQYVHATRFPPQFQSAMVSKLPEHHFLG